MVNAKDAPKTPEIPHQTDNAPHPVSGLWWRLYLGTTLRSKLMLPALGLIVGVIALLGWFAWETVLATVNNIYEQKARAIANVVSKSVLDEDYVLYYSEKIDADLARLNRLYPDVYRITVLSEVRDTVHVISSTDPTLTGQALASETLEKLWTPSAPSLVREEGALEFFEVNSPIYDQASMIGLVQVDLSLAERDRYVQDIAWKTGLGALIGISALFGLLFVLLRVVVAKPVEVLSEASQRMSMGQYQVSARYGSRPKGARIRDEIARLMDAFNHMVAAIRERDARLEAMIVEDHLTGVYNRQHFDHVARTEIERASRYRHPLSFLLLDVDHLDGVNQAQGQAAGDLLLKEAASLMVETFRQVDLVFRYGGDEFTVILPETDEKGCEIAQQRLTESLSYLNQNKLVKLSLSFRSATWNPDPAAGWQIDHDAVMKQVLAAQRATGAIKALAHITGGGLTENIPRVLPDELRVEIDHTAYTRPPVFDWLQTTARLDDAGMHRTFNNGIGMVVVCTEANAEALLAALGEGKVIGRLLG